MQIADYPLAGCRSNCTWFLPPLRGWIHSIYPHPPGSRLGLPSRARSRGVYAWSFHNFRELRRLR